MSARTYRFAPRDRTGWVLGLSGPQVLVLGAALLAGVLASSRGTSVAVSALPALAGAGLAFGRLGGRPLLEAGPPALAWAVRALRKRNRWEVAPSPEPAAGTADDDGEETEAPKALALPPPLDAQVVTAVDATAYDAALVGRRLAL